MSASRLSRLAGLVLALAALVGGLASGGLSAPAAASESAPDAQVTAQVIDWE